MKLGYFTMPLHPVGRDWRQTLAEDREAVLLAERLLLAEDGELFIAKAKSEETAKRFAPQAAR